MIEFILFVLGSVGMSHIIVDGSIFESSRNWLEKKSKFFHTLATCYLCSAFYTGMLCSVFMLSAFLNTSTTWLEYAMRVFICGCAGGFLSMTAAIILIRLNKNDND